MDAMRRWQERTALTTREFAARHSDARHQLMMGRLNSDEYSRLILDLTRQHRAAIANHHTVYELAKAAEDMRAEFKL